MHMQPQDLQSKEVLDAVVAVAEMHVRLDVLSLLNEVNPLVLEVSG